MMLPHIARRIFATPLMITRTKLDIILGVLAPRMQGADLPIKQENEVIYEFDITEEGIAIIPILGTLVRRTVGLEAESGLMSYHYISLLLNEAKLRPDVKGIVLDIDSPGGEAGAVFDLADKILEVRKIKPIWAVANEEAFSAAYALAASAERLFIPRTAGVGSIGVIAVHLDQSKADADEGLKYTSIYAGAHKNDYSPHEPLADPARESLQKEIDRIYGLFVSCVARGRNLSPETIRKTEAALFFGEEAIAAGLADQLGGLTYAVNELTASLLTSSKKEKRMTDPKEQPAIEKKEAPLPDLETSKADFIEKTRADARAEAMAYVAEVHDLCALAGVPHKATQYIVKNVSAKAVRHELLEKKANASEQAEITGHIPTPDPQAAGGLIDTAAIYEKRNNKKGE